MNFLPLPQTGGKAVKLFSKKNKTQGATSEARAPRKPVTHPFSAINALSSSSNVEIELFDSLREAVPVIDAAIGKLVRLLGEFRVECEDKALETELTRFVRNVRCIGGGVGLSSFIYTYFDQLLTYGTAVGEIIPSGDMRGVWGLYNASLKDVSVTSGENPMELKVCRRDMNLTPVENPELVLVSLHSPKAGSAEGTSILKGLSFVSSILLKIYSSVGQNWERAGNIRYAVTYNPPANSQVNASKRAREIAEEWGRAMRDDSSVCDFVSVGDVSIKVIGADNQILDCDVPVRHILEQIVSKLSIPPFLLGLSWSSTERMSAVQTDILTSEIEYWRTLLTPVIRKICKTHLNFMGYQSPVDVVWSNVSLQDEKELSAARLNNARAMQIERELEVKV